MSLPPWERGLKSNNCKRRLVNAIVAPPVGAWIEISNISLEIFTTSVAPPVGAWIEIANNFSTSGAMIRRSPRGSVD